MRPLPYWGRLPFALVLPVFFGCATIVSGTDQEVVVSSNPSGASFEVKNRDRVMVATGETPSTITVARAKSAFRSERYLVTIKNGTDERLQLQRATTNGWWFGNIIFGGPLGMILDPMTGAAFAFSKVWFEDFEVDDQP